MKGMTYIRVVIVWKLAETMRRLGVTQYALQRDSGLALNTIRAMHSGKTERPDLGVLNRVISTLRDTTGQDVRLADVLEWREEIKPAPAPAGDDA